MPPKSSNRIALATALVLGAMTALALCPAAAADNGSPWGGNYFPNVPLVTQDGKTVHFYDDLLRGKTVVINFIYTKCGDTCPLETAKLAQVQRLLGERVGKDVFFYSISIDPERDTPQELKAYADKFHVKPGWLFLTGEKKDVELIRKKLGQAARPGENALTGHSTTLTLGDEATGQWMQDSALDDPKYVAVMVGDWLSSWQHHAPGTSYTEARIVDSDKGAYLFKTRCAACHTVGHGDGVGPDLIGVSSIRSRSWLTQFIEMPDKMVAERDPIATALYNKYKQVPMPNLRLGDPDVAALIAYLDAQTRERNAGVSPKKTSQAK
ncbi:MAG: electron transporter SenC [Acidobacteria bacterium]|nr:MAG: electron transporter SenC [Acidobacteriota bacterium]PYY05847.1 MAG: electron transporter SenC [Acidobacteriota bacterium]